MNRKNQKQPRHQTEKPTTGHRTFPKAPHWAIQSHPARRRFMPSSA